MTPRGKQEARRKFGVFEVKKGNSGLLRSQFFAWRWRSFQRQRTEDILGQQSATNTRLSGRKTESKGVHHHDWEQRDRPERLG